MALNQHPADNASAAPAEDSPKTQRLLFPLGVASLLLGLLFVFFWVLMGRGSDVPDIDAAANDTRRWVLIAAGSFLTLQGLGLLIARIVGSKSIGAGAARNRLLANVVLGVALASTLLVLVNYVFARHELWRVDMTSQSFYTLSQESQQLVKVLDQDIRITLLMPRGGSVGEVERLIDQYQAASRRVTTEHYNPRIMKPEDYRAKLEEFGLDPDMPEAELMGLVVEAGVMSAAGWTSAESKHISARDLWQRDTSDPMNPRQVFYGERLISSAIREVTEDEQPRIYFLSGHGELDINDFDEKRSMSRLIKILRQRNYEVQELNILSRDEVDVPADADLLVVAGPKKGLSAFELSALQKYLDSGGRALFLLEPLYRKGQGGAALFEATGIETLLSKSYGVDCRNELIFLKFRDPRSPNESGRPVLYIQDLDPTHKITSPLAIAKARVFLYGARPLGIRPMRGLEAKELLTTKSWGARCFSSVNPTSAQTPSMMRQGPFTVGAALDFTPPEGDGREPSRVVVFGDVHWITNQLLQDRAYFNQELILNTVNWLMRRDANMIGQAHRATSYRLSMTQGTLDRMQALACPGLPAIALALGLFAWLIRAKT